MRPLVFAFLFLASATLAAGAPPPPVTKADVILKHRAVDAAVFRGQRLRRSHRLRQELAHPLRAATPTLLLVGEGDIECPPPQSHEFWRALRRRGVPTVLVVYPTEGHGFLRPENRRDAMRRRAAWLAEHLGRLRDVSRPDYEFRRF